MTSLVFHVGDQDFTDEEAAIAAGIAASEGSIDWSEVDETGLTIAQGGRCIDPDRVCQKWWTHWRE